MCYRLLGARLIRGSCLRERVTLTEGKGYGISEVDIEGEEVLHERCKEEVPVLFFDGRRAFKFRVEEKALRRKLDLLLLRQRLLGA